MNITKKDKKYLVRSEPGHEIEIIKTDKNFLISSTGKKYLDFTMGWCVGNLGWDNKEIKAKLKAFKGPYYVSPSFQYKPWVELAELLAKITPGKLSKSFRATGGTEAVEIALRTATAYTKRHKFISIEGSYHGDSIGTMSIGSSDYKKHQKGLLFNTYKIKPPLNNAAADKIEKILQRKEVAAVIMEPIICNLAVVIPEQIFMTRLQELCKKYNTLLIIDEVATGFGRTGKLFATEHFNIEPDIMCFAKAITGGYCGMGATITTDKIAKAMEYESSFWSTYGWHPLSVEAALANIKFILKNKKQLLQNTALMSDYFHERLSTMDFKIKPEIRIKGLAIGIEFTKGNYAEKIAEKAKKNGLIVSLHNSKEFTMFPPLNITKQIAKKGLDILEKCL